ncbi:hypothetical protein [Campylobacter devanensis]|uniref:hypothetical protein n=1 Tax=Campylobacter devanensis TaxID=3161138 RepID=UPI000A3454F0|nr:hypothetical protein [Campylobacter sp. P0136]
MKQANDIVNFYDEDGNLVGVSKINKRDDVLNEPEELQALQASPQQRMNEEASIAYEIWINSATLENDFTPITERKLAELLTTKGISSSSSRINRWKQKYGWNKLLEHKINLALIENKELNRTIKHAALGAAVENTKVDIERNTALLATAYSIAEIELTELYQKRQNGSLSKDEFKRFEALFKIVADRDDRMNDRLAHIATEAVSSVEVFERLNQISLDIETE